MANWGNIGTRGRVEDRRGIAPLAGGLSLTGLALILALNFLTGGDVTDVLLQSIDQIDKSSLTQDSSEFTGADEYEVFVSTVLGSNNSLWAQKFVELHKQYQEPTLVLFRQATQSGCGVASSEIGPHYCPLDQTIYLDETFFDELTNRFGAQGGDVAEAYVIAHEVAHHVQNQLGTMDELNTKRSASGRLSNQASIMLELQADCYAGIWSNSIRDQQVLEPGEIQEAMDAAAAVGDDRIQKSVTGEVHRESWTHGSSAQRLEWFTRGYETGSIEACDTFSE